MTLDEWLRQRGVKTHQYLGQPVTDLRKDEAADENLKFLRTASVEDLGKWYENLRHQTVVSDMGIGTGERPPRMTKEQVLALGDRQGFDLSHFLAGVEPKILPPDIGSLIADQYKKADEPMKRQWLDTAANLFGNLADAPEQLKEVKDHVAGIDFPMQAKLVTVLPEAFNDHEKKALLDRALEHPHELTAGGFSGDLASRALTADFQSRRDDAPPPWWPELIALRTFVGRPSIDTPRSADAAVNRSNAKKYSDALAHLNSGSRQINASGWRQACDMMMETFAGEGGDEFLKHTPQEALDRVGRSMAPYPQAYGHWLNVMEKKIQDPNYAGLTPGQICDRIVTHSRNPEQIERVMRSVGDAEALRLAAESSLRHRGEYFGGTDRLEIASKIAGEYLKSFGIPTGGEQFYLHAIGRDLARNHRHKIIEHLYRYSDPHKQSLAAESFALPYLSHLAQDGQPISDERRAFANEIFSKAYNHGDLQHTTFPDQLLHNVEPSDLAPIHPDTAAKFIASYGQGLADRFVEGLPDEHLAALHRHLQDVHPGSLLNHVKGVLESRKPAEAITFTPNSNRLRLLREHLEQQPDKRAHKKVLEQAGFNVGSMGLNPMVDAKGNLTFEALDQHIKSLPTRTVEHKAMTWGKPGTHPHSVGQQRHSNEMSRVFSVALPKDEANKIAAADPQAWRHFQHNANGSAQGGHPTIPGRGIGWIRYTEGPDGIHIDEIQSDFGSNLRAKAQSSYDPDRLAEFERAYQQVWQGQKPNDVLHEAFLEHLRQNGKVGRKVQLWNVKGKSQLAGQDINKEPPVHMRETYKNMPAKAGYSPSTYGTIQTQSHPALQGEDTWEQKLAKFEKSLDTCFTDRLEKGWRHNLLGAVAAGALALSSQSESPKPAPSESQGELVDAPVAGATGINQQTLATKAPRPTPKWTPQGLSEEMYPIAHLESSFGRNVNHAKHPAGEFQTAYGALGLKPMTAHFEYMKRPSLRALHPGLEDQKAFTEELKSNPRFYNQVAGAHFAWLKSALGGDPAKAAYGWRWGIGAAQQALPEQIEADPYVQRYKQMREQALQAKMTAMFDAALQKSVLPTTPVRMHEGKLQTLIGHDWEDVATKTKDGWQLLGKNHTRATKLLARCLLDGEEIES